MRKSGILVTGLLFLLFLSGTAPTSATNFTVTKTTNSNDGACDADCSLREAVAAADSGDTVLFDHSLFGPFTLGGSEIVITKRITIDGFIDSVNVVFLSGNMTSRIFSIATGGGLDLRNMTLVQGNGVGAVNSNVGGAIYAQPSSVLSLDRVDIRGNTASNHSGAVFSDHANVHILNSSLSGNTSTECTALHVFESNVTIANVTITGNRDTDLNDADDRGAVCIYDSPTTMRNSTIAYNTVNRSGIVVIHTHAPDAIFNIGNTIVAQNDILFGGDVDDFLNQGQVVSAGGNLIGSTFQVGAGVFTLPNDQLGVNPLLAPTNSFQGGHPITTHPLQAGSPAINTGINANAVDPQTNSPLINDSRGAGFPRVAGGAVDKGAFEDQSNGSSLVVTKLTDSNDSVCDLDCSLREAVAAAASDPGTDTITMAANVAGTIDTGGTQITISNNDVNIIGYPTISASTLVVSGGNLHRIFNITSGSDVSLTGLTLANGHAVGAGLTGRGGAIYLDGNSNLTLDRVIVRNNLSSLAAIELQSGTHRIINATINNNTADTCSALHPILSAALSIANTTISTNSNTSAASGEGTLCLDGVGTTIRNSTIAFNRTTNGTGGGIRSIGPVNLGNTIVSNNLAPNGPDIFEAGFQSLSSSGGNLVQDTNGFPADTFNKPADHTGVDPQLGVLTDNGGNVTTHAIGNFSAAVNNGLNTNAVDPFDNSPLTTDARGLGNPRTQGNSVDKGAYESAAPTAATATISGRIVNEHDVPVAGVVINLGGTQVRKIITNANGEYRFLDVETNGFYTVTPSRVNYNFNPVNRSFSQIGSKTEAVFNATSTGDEANPLDTAEYFVRQQYLDILSREPDEAGFNYWSDQILVCGSNVSCVRAQRIGVAAAFFIEQEAQQSGSFIYDMYVGTVGRRPVFNEFSADRQQVVGGANLDAEKKAFAHSFVQRPAFLTMYQDSVTAESFVDALMQQVHQSTGFDLSSERANLISIYYGGADANGARALVVRSIADNAAFKQSQYNQAFVLTEYFGYLHRDPDQGGYDFWVNVLNTGDPGNYRGMVCSFITSTEYQRRISTVVSHSNAECGSQ